VAVYKRTPQNYDGSKVTSHHVTNLLPLVLSSIGNTFAARPDLILAAWPGIVGQQVASSTEATAMVDGVIHVKVRNSTLYSLLAKHEKNRLLAIFRSRFPSAQIRGIVFKMG
jgi:hypothetical protein